MHELIRKSLIVISIAVIAGIPLYFLGFKAKTLPVKEQQNTIVEEAGRPAGDGIISPEASVVSEAMIGTWQSAEDPNFTREFRDDGRVVDRYVGNASATSEGIWGAFTADMASAGTTTGLAPGVVYVQMTFDDMVLYFSIVKAADTLEMVYLDRGNQLTFTRVP
ncbi:hypothetical protein COU18_00665 [Candidatus Kaiserbacteria bacterium CG10_big_fil_rev_8_21_14_0_10_51_14]|uniref:DUF5640 domain-containing protein n=1 Tax=Candidatus Kaiserbacteria bacterium CG10_big_fil_rev_8_21_14_0_10_51_14 TaxID=1974610 RepID=A0A2H0UBW8_9BACT|nr:MAG: hypothetical protein COU18_00665 [Candidatus Kaiserbacteria bacterium CG10_big_fil_rev_8_21_14_0_10_51_14]